MWFRACRLALLAAWLAVAAAPPTPSQHYGFTPGEDYKLVDYNQLIAYFQRLDAASERLQLVEFGRTSLGKPMYVAFISSEENLRRLEHLKSINRRLALAQASLAEASELARQGKVFVWIDSGLHATEVAPSQHASDLAYRMVSDESPEFRRIRDKVILLQIPCINPDGLDMVVHWYRQNVGTPYELAPLPRLYQKYAGHDNNRDWFMLNLTETRHVTRLLFQDWFPHIVYNQHQSPPFPARIFVPPYAEPLNPNIPAAVMEGIHLIGSAMKERFARENKSGVLSYHGFDAWWNGGLRSVPAFHNMHGILTETAAYAYGTPREYKAEDLPERFSNGIPTREPSVFYQRPWLGGRWSVRDAIEYMLTADFAILDLAAARAEEFLLKAWQMAHDNIQLGRSSPPFAYVLPREQWDLSSAVAMLERLQLGGIEVRHATRPFTAGGKQYSAGSWVLLAAQPFRPYLLDLLEPQKYPELRAGTTGPTKRPYDVAGWTLSLNMGVTVERIDAPFEAPLEVLSKMEPPSPSLDVRQNHAFIALARALEAGQTVWRAADGALSTSPTAGSREIRRPRVALYEPWTANMDAGWTQWVLDQYRVPYTLVHNEDVRKGGLRARFDAFILASQSAASILHGYKLGERIGGARSLSGPYDARGLQRPEYTGGIGVEGLAELDRFVRQGGLLIALDAATELPLQFFDIGVRGVLRSGEGEGTGEYYNPGSILRITVDTSHSVAAGMPAAAYAFSSGGQAFEITLEPSWNRDERLVRTIVRYADKNLLASGWLSGERQIAGRPAVVEARMGQGRVILFGFRPQFRGQTFGTFKLLLNALYESATVPARSASASAHSAVLQDQR